MQNPCLQTLRVIISGFFICIRIYRMKRAIKSEAIVLKKRSLPNQDKIITLFTKELGKLSAFAKGIKKITSRRLPHVQTANLINVVLYKKDERYFLHETALIAGVSEIKKDQEKIQILYQFFFVLERLLPDSQVEFNIYNLLMNFLVDLSAPKNNYNVMLLTYLNKTVYAMGYTKEEKNYEDIRRMIEDIIHEKMPELHI